MKERVNYQREARSRAVVPLRLCVSEIVSASFEDGIAQYEAGKMIRKSIGNFFQEHEGMLPESFVFSPDLMIFVPDVSLARYHYGQVYEQDRNSPTGFKYTTVKTVVRQNQKDMYTVWVTHGGLILGAIENNFGRAKLSINE